MKIPREDGRVPELLEALKQRKIAPNAHPCVSLVLWKSLRDIVLVCEAPFGKLMGEKVPTQWGKVIIVSKRHKIKMAACVSASSSLEAENLVWDVPCVKIIQ